MDSWMVSHGLDGSITRSYRPGSTDGAFVFSCNSSGSCASSPRQSQPSPATHSQPRPTGGASGRLHSNRPGAPATGKGGNPGGTPTPRRPGGGTGGAGGNSCSFARL